MNLSQLSADLRRSQLTPEADRSWVGVNHEQLLTTTWPTALHEDEDPTELEVTAVATAAAAAAAAADGSDGSGRVTARTPHDGDYHQQGERDVPALARFFAERSYPLRDRAAMAALFDQQNFMDAGADGPAAPLPAPTQRHYKMTATPFKLNDNNKNGGDAQDTGADAAADSSAHTRSDQSTGGGGVVVGAVGAVGLDSSMAAAVAAQIAAVAANVAEQQPSTPSPSVGGRAAVGATPPNLLAQSIVPPTPASLKGELSYTPRRTELTSPALQKLTEKFEGQGRSKAPYPRFVRDWDGVPAGARVRVVERGGVSSSPEDPEDIVNKTMDAIDTTLGLTTPYRRAHQRSGGQRRRGGGGTGGVEQRDHDTSTSPSSASSASSSSSKLGRVARPLRAYSPTARKIEVIRQIAALSAPRTPAQVRPLRVCACLCVSVCVCRGVAFRSLQFVYTVSLLVLMLADSPRH